MPLAGGMGHLGASIPQNTWRTLTSRWCACEDRQAGVAASDCRTSRCLIQSSRPPVARGHTNLEAFEGKLAAKRATTTLSTSTSTTAQTWRATSASICLTITESCSSMFIFVFLASALSFPSRICPGDSARSFPDRSVLSRIAFVGTGRRGVRTVLCLCWVLVDRV